MLLTSYPGIMNGDPKRVYFDFCETLIQFQTADRFVDFCRKELQDRRMIRLHEITSCATKIRLFSMLNRVFRGNNLHKRLVLYQLKGINRSTLENLAEKYFENEIKPAVIQPVMAIMKRHIAQGDEVWIVSGGYDIYIKHFVQRYGLRGYVASTIAFDTKGFCLGRMTEDCMGKQKLQFLRKTIGDDWNKCGSTVAYSDNRSDLPLLMAVSSGIVVSHKRHQTWTEKYNFKEIIWK